MRDSVLQTCFARKLVLQGNSFCRETRLLLMPLKLLSLYLWLKILLVTQKLVTLYRFVIFFKKNYAGSSN